MQMYTQDHEECLPFSVTVWTDVNVDAGILVCPTLGKATPNAYLYDGDYCSGKGLGELTDPTTTWLTADGSNDTFDLRHSGKAVVSFVDGHVTATTVKKDEIVQLTPALLHPLAQWNGSASSGDGLLTTADMAVLFDGDASTGLEIGKSNASPTLTSPRPFIVTRVEIVVSSTDATRSFGDIQVMPVGSASFVNTGLHVPNNLALKTLWKADIPDAYQVPVSAIRFSNGNFWVRLNELRFYGKPVGGICVDLTQQGTLRTAPGTESPVGSLRNGVLESTGTCYHASPNTHRLVVDFGVAKKVNYVAVNPNGYWKPSWSAAGAPTEPVNMNNLTSYSGWASDAVGYSGLTGNGSPGHVWVVMPINNGIAIPLCAAGVSINNFWGDLSEISVLNVQPTSLRFD